MIPDKKELLAFIEKRDFVNLSMIAKFFKIKNNTASDLVQDLNQRGLVTIIKSGGSKYVKVKKR